MYRVLGQLSAQLGQCLVTGPTSEPPAVPGPPRARGTELYSLA